MADANISDESFARRALELAREGIGLTSPNPCVGAVIVDDKGKIVGTGFHKYETLKHAEVLALEQAGEKARGATLYTNLEPFLGAVFALLVLSERLHTLQLIGGLVIASGIVLGGRVKLSTPPID